MLIVTLKVNLKGLSGTIYAAGTYRSDNPQGIPEDIMKEVAYYGGKESKTCSVVEIPDAPSVDAAVDVKGEAISIKDIAADLDDDDGADQFQDIDDGSVDAAAVDINTDAAHADTGVAAADAAPDSVPAPTTSTAPTVLDGASKPRVRKRAALQQ